MLLCVGEILADMIGNGRDEYLMRVGGAPFNVAVNASQCGASVGFIGRAGKDPIGLRCLEQASEVGFRYLGIQRDPVCNTTLAFVSLNDSGERSFAFFRHDTADYQIAFEEIDFDELCDVNIVHLGSLLLSERKGLAFARRFVEEIDRRGWRMSFDLNHREDLFGPLSSCRALFREFVERADIVKFSEDEILAYTGKNSVDAALESLPERECLYCVTCGDRGSLYRRGAVAGSVPVRPVKPVDTTGAGDAFFGALLSQLEGREFLSMSEEELRKIFSVANEAGARATLFKGAVRI